MKTGHVALFLAIVLVVSSSDGMAARSGPNHFQDTCAATISPGPVCDPGKCSSDCASRFRGGMGGCESAGCRCVYTCAAPPPAAGSYS